MGRSQKSGITFGSHLHTRSGSTFRRWLYLWLKMLVSNASGATRRNWLSTQPVGMKMVYTTYLAAPQHNARQTMVPREGGVPSVCCCCIFARTGIPCCTARRAPLVHATEATHTRLVGCRFPAEAVPGVHRRLPLRHAAGAAPAAVCGARCRVARLRRGACRRPAGGAAPALPKSGRNTTRQVCKIQPMLPDCCAVILFLFHTDTANDAAV